MTTQVWATCASIGHNAGSVAVVLNSARLLRLEDVSPVAIGAVGQRRRTEGSTEPAVPSGVWLLQYRRGASFLYGSKAEVNFMFRGVFVSQQRSSLFRVLGMIVAAVALSSYARGQEGPLQTVPSQDRERTQQRPSPFSEWDKDGDGYLTRQEFPSRFADSLFDRIDADRNGRISRSEDDTDRAEKQARQEGQTRQSPNGERRIHRNAAGRLGLPVDVKVLKGITYATMGDRKLPLDLYLPTSADEPAPLVIWIHGGGWRGGSKEDPARALPLLERGYAVASVEYRLSGEAVFPAAIEDCKAAVSFLRLNALKYNIDPDRFGVWG